MYRLLQPGEIIAQNDQIKTITTTWKDARNHVGDKAEADEIRRPLEYFVVDAQTTHPFKNETKCAVYMDEETRAKIIRAVNLIKDFPGATITFGFNTGRFFQDSEDEVNEICEKDFDDLYKESVLSIEIRIISNILLLLDMMTVIASSLPNQLKFIENYPV